MIFFVFDVDFLGFVFFNFFCLVVEMILVEDFDCILEVYLKVVFIVGVLGIFIKKILLRYFFDVCINCVMCF